MLYREVPKNGDKLSVLGYGCMRLPVRLQSIDERLAEKQILHAMDHGVNYFDSGYNYHGGNSERVLGKALQLGVFGVIDKPVNMDILHQLLNRIFQKRYNSSLFAV